MIRTFIAIPLPSNVIATLSELIEELKSNLPKVSWVKPINIHLTLKFLGNIHENKIPEIKQTMINTSNIAPFSLTGNGISVFPNVKRVRVIWTGVKGDLGKLQLLYSQLEEGLNTLGFSKEERSFTPHLTLGRVKKIINTQILTQVLKKYRDFTTPSFLVKEIVLFKSELHPKGAVYTPLEKVCLKE